MSRQLVADFVVWQGRGRLLRVVGSLLPGLLVGVGAR